MTTPRSGSTLLFNILKNNALATQSPPTQKFFEPFHTDTLDTIEYLDLDISLYIQEVFNQYSYCADSEKISGFKIFIHQAEKFVKKYNSINNTDLTVGDFFGFFPKNTKCIRLIRKSNIHQAISLYKARYTKVFLKKTNSKTKELNVPFDFLKIQECLKEIECVEEKTSELLSTFFVPQLTLEYETYTRDIVSTVKKISAYLGVERNAPTEKTDLFIQRDANTQKMYIKFCLFQYARQSSLLRYLVHCVKVVKSII